MTLETAMEALVGKTLPLPPYLSEQDKKTMSEALLKGGLAAPTHWYKVQVIDNHRVEDDRSKLLSYSLRH